MKREFRTILAAGTILVPLAMMPQLAWAQSGEQNASGGLQEIIVTAQKREQSVQDVPIAVTALTQDAIAANRVTSVNDLSGLAPGVTVRETAGGVGVPSFSIRGVVSYGVVPGSDKQVSIYLDGVYIASPRGSIFNLPDVARIEVLRGPQGTLFGRNATAGAVSVTTRDPSGDAGARATFSVGNYDHFGARISADLPQMGPFSAYFSFAHDYTRGDIENSGAGTTWDRSVSTSNLDVVRSPRWLGTTKTDSYFAAVKFEPSYDFNTVVKFDRSEDNGTPDGQAFVGYDASTPLIGDLVGALVNFQPGGINSAPDAKRPKIVDNSFASQRYQKVTGVSATSTWQASDAISVKNIFAYRKSSVFTASPIDGFSGLSFTPQAIGPYATLIAFTNPAFEGMTTEQRIALIPTIAGGLVPLVGQPFVAIGSQSLGTSKQWSDELQVTYTSNLLTLTAGALWFHGKDVSGGPEGTQATMQFTPVPGGIIPAGSQAISYNKATSIAAYAQAELHVTDELTLMGGARITKDKKSGHFDIGYVGALTSFPFTYKKTKPNFMLGVNYQPTLHTLIYGKFSTAFVSGGSTAGIEYKPETATSWEAGLKADFLDRRLRTNLAVYTVTYKNFQTAQAGSTFVGVPGFPSFIAALPTFVYPQGGPVKAKGFELEVTAAPVTGLTFGGSAGYTDTKFEDVDPLLVLGNGGAYAPSLRPKWSGTLWGQYETPELIGDTTLLFRLDANWRTSMALDANPDRGVDAYLAVQKSPATWILNGRVALQNLHLGGVDAQLSLWGKNLTNDRSAVYALISPVSASATFQKARTWGLDLTVEY
ncbi:TonB-dependent receptor [Novosphingobium malaysiense]|uniref:TonB-dependent receptor n=1 Tax=Novosphingobium malaysiense TaxID=1348853 RepID=A0A0B1ZH66_9SPHN|nr:TonB-dependent receptor [Novosphingobium malaysiense]KHK89862.1 hypothetical protein LK12_18310 [Novosphingobium malaysiense]